jgi:hypothetical protein
MMQKIKIMPLIKIIKIKNLSKTTRVLRRPTLLIHTLAETQQG